MRQNNNKRHDYIVRLALQPHSLVECHPVGSTYSKDKLVVGWVRDDPHREGIAPESHDSLQLAVSFRGAEMSQAERDYSRMDPQTCWRHWMWTKTVFRAGWCSQIFPIKQWRDVAKQPHCTFTFPPHHHRAKDPPMKNPYATKQWKDISHAHTHTHTILFKLSSDWEISTPGNPP